MKKTIVFLIVSSIMPGYIWSAADQSKTPEQLEKLNTSLCSSFLRKDFNSAERFIAEGADPKRALRDCSEETPEGTVVRRSVFGGMKLLPLPFSKETPQVGKEKWLELLKPHGIVDIREHK